MSFDKDYEKNTRNACGAEHGVKMKTSTWAGILSVLCSPIYAKESEVATCKILQELSSDSVSVVSKSEESHDVPIGLFERSGSIKLLGETGFCELAINDSKGGSFLNCWTPDMEFGARSDRSEIDNSPQVMNSLVLASRKTGYAIKIRVKCRVK